MVLERMSVHLTLRIIYPDLNTLELEGQNSDLLLHSDKDWLGFDDTILRSLKRERAIAFFQQEQAIFLYSFICSASRPRGQIVICVASSYWYVNHDFQSIQTLLLAVSGQEDPTANAGMTIF